jgi:hypothetical protein
MQDGTRSARPFFLLLLLALCLAGATASAQNVWETFSYQQWTKGDVKKMLTASPWAKSVKYTIPLNVMPGAGELITTAESPVILLRSALPIRQALVRERQLAAKYDKMSEAERAAFDLKTKELLGCPACDKNYVIMIKFPSSTLGNQSFIMERKKYIYLTNEKGERRELIHFVPQSATGIESLFFFPRFNDKNEPLLTPDNKKLTFRFDLAVFDGKPFPFEKIDFEVAPLVKDGKVVF